VNNTPIMRRSSGPEDTTLDLLSDLLSGGALQPLGEGAIVLRGFTLSLTGEVLAELDLIRDVAPFRHMVTPGGHSMSVAMTNCGSLGWISDHRGYRYQGVDLGGKPWPAMPQIFRSLATRAAETAGFPGFQPDSCLINLYEPGARLSLHQDRNERDFSHPIVSVSLGLSAVFLFGGLRRTDIPRRIRLEHGDVVVWGGASRLAFHGVNPLGDGWHPMMGRSRINLTFRKAG
jgi:alkylated DNA repair protein (DNA oxidative demethylase)